MIQTRTVSRISIAETSSTLLAGWCAANWLIIDSTLISAPPSVAALSVTTWAKRRLNPTLELAMEYTGALSTIVFDELCCLRDLTEAQIGRNQFAMDMAVDWLDGEVDHTAERISVLEDKVADLELSCTELLALGWEQVEISTRGARGLGQLATAVLAQQAKIRLMEERMDAMREMIVEVFVIASHVT